MIWIQRLRKEEKGLTLIELLAVIVILGIIAAIAIPTIGGLINKTKDNAEEATAIQFYEAARLYIIAEMNGDFNNKTVTYGELKTGGYLDSAIKVGGEDLDDSSNIHFNANKDFDIIFYKKGSTSSAYKNFTESILNK
jgi:type IV pilus assembly protein PilA